jgi:Fe-S oxidoreductase
LSADNGGSPAPRWDDPATIETLDLCLSCKACKTECPSNVDISRLKAEYTAQRYRAGGTPLAARLFGHIRVLNQIGAVWPDLSNWFARLDPVRRLINKTLGLSAKRSLPPFSSSLFRWFKRRPRFKSGSKVILFADCFTAYNEPRIGQAAVTVLESLGYEVLLPKVGCCGRAMISNGLLADAIKTIEATAAQLNAAVADPSVKAILFLEPSCLSSIADEWLQLKLEVSVEKIRNALAAKSFLAEDFVERFWDQHPKRPQIAQRGTSVLLHGHCHQKALWGTDTTAAGLRRFTGDVSVLPSGCCGMAGAFGYTAEHYDLSMKIGELSLFPPVRLAPSDVIIAAPGTSCRHQIRDGTGREALHPIEVIHRTL